MARTIFRKKSLDRISSPEQLNDYIRVTNPGVWMIMCSVVLLLLGMCVWSVFGQLDTYLTVAAVTDNNQTVCYVKASDAQELEDGLLVWIGDEQYHIADIQTRPVQVDDTYPEYILHVGSLQEGEWAYIATLDHMYGENGMIVEAEIVIESIAPIRFVMN